MNRSLQYSQDLSSSKPDPRIQCNANQIPATYFTEYKQNNCKIPMERENIHNQAS